LIQQLAKSAPNQLPMYAEKAFKIITLENRNIFIKTLNDRLDSIEKESKKKRILKVIDQVSKII
jgi:hypothetical protein